MTATVRQESEVKIYTSGNKCISVTTDNPLSPKEYKKKYEEDGHNVRRVFVRTIVYAK